MASSSTYSQQQWQFHAQSLSQYGLEPSFDLYSSSSQSPQPQQDFDFEYTQQPQRQSPHGWSSEHQSQFSTHDRGHGLRLDSLPLGIAHEHHHCQQTYTPSPIDQQTMAWPWDQQGYPTPEYGMPQRTYSPYSDSSYDDPMSTNYSQDSMNVFDMTFAQSLDSNTAPVFDEFSRASPFQSDGSSASSTYSLSPPLTNELPLLMRPVASPSLTAPISPAGAAVRPSASTSSSTTTVKSSRPTSSKIDANSHRRRFPCAHPECGRRFTSQYTLKVHMEAHKPKPRVTFPCTMGCNERFSRQHDRLRHEVAKHAKVCEHSCADCGRFFSTAKTLGNHKCPVAGNGPRWVHA